MSPSREWPADYLRTVARHRRVPRNIFLICEENIRKLTVSRCICIIRCKEKKEKKNNGVIFMSDSYFVNDATYVPGAF